MSNASARYFRTILAAVIVTLLVAWTLRSINVGRVTTELRAIVRGWLLAAALCFACILPLWTLQWYLLAPLQSRPRYSTMLAVVSVTSAVLNTMPMFVGEGIGILLLVTRAGLERGAALSLLSMDQLLVGMAKIVLLALAAQMAEPPLWMLRGMSVLAIGVIVLAFALFLVHSRRDVVSGFLRARGLPMLSSLAGDAAHALAPLRSATRIGPALLLALLKKAVEIAAILCVQRAFGVQLGIGSGIIILAALSLATLVPLVPGNIGVYEATVTWTYMSFGLPVERALGIAVVQHAVYLTALALPGLITLAFVALRRSPALADAVNSELLSDRTL